MNLSCFLADQSQLAKVFRRDVDELKRLQQEHLSKLDINSNPLSFDELIQQQIQKLYHYRNADEDDDEENDFDQEKKFIRELDQLHDEHVSWLKKKKKDSKLMAPITERLRMFFFLRKNLPFNLLFLLQRNFTIILQFSMSNRSLFSLVFFVYIDYYVR